MTRYTQQNQGFGCGSIIFVLILMMLAPFILEFISFFILLFLAWLSSMAH